MSGLTPAEARLLEVYRNRWGVGFHDPSWIGWLSVAGYGAAAVLAGHAARAAGRAAIGFDRNFWLAVCFAMTFLALNKQLDLQVLITDLGREWAVRNGLYQQRRVFQTAFMAAVSLGALVGGLLLWFATRGRSASLRLAFAGLALCSSYIVVRAASFHHTDVLLRSTIGGGRWNWAIEWAGFTLTALAAWRYNPGEPPRDPPAGR